jgi:hypothetical protein
LGPNGSPYVFPAELSLFTQEAFLAQATGPQKERACLDASAELDAYFRGRYALPLAAWGNEVKRYTAYIALRNIAETIGYAPQAGSDSNILKNYYFVVGWPDRPGSGWGPGVQRQAIHPDVTPSVAQPGDPVHDVPQVFTSPQRGWTNRLANPQRIG